LSSGSSLDVRLIQALSPLRRSPTASFSRRQSEPPASPGLAARHAPAPSSRHYSEPPHPKSVAYSDPLSSDPEEEEDDESVNSVSEPTILKPAGEAGRPESGGYNLRAAMKWSSSAYSNLQVR